MQGDRGAVDEIHRLDEQTIYQKCVVLGDEQIAVRCVGPQSALRDTHGQNALGISAVGRSSVHAATDPCDWLCLTAQRHEQIADPKVFDFPFAVWGQQTRTTQKARSAAAIAMVAIASVCPANCNLCNGNSRQQPTSQQTASRQNIPTAPTQISTVLSLHHDVSGKVPKTGG
jgi:hypothetical protein